MNVQELREKANVSQEYMASVLGMSRGTYRAIEEGRRGIKPHELKMLENYFGGSIEVKDQEPTKQVPLLPITVIGGQDTEWNDVGVSEYECEKIVCQIHDAELAIRVSGDSMYPRYSNGSIVFIKKVDPTIFIEWGAYYVLNTTNGNIIKRVMKKDDTTIECRSVNPDYSSFDVPIPSVRGWYKILGCLTIE